MTLRPLDPAPPKPPGDPMRKVMMAVAIGVPILRTVARLVAGALAKEPRTCPKCSYRMVSQVYRLGGRGGRTPVGYWRCSACAARYKTLGEGDAPFQPAPDDEWNRTVPFRFPR